MKKVYRNFETAVKYKYWGIVAQKGLEHTQGGRKLTKRCNNKNFLNLYKDTNIQEQDSQATLGR